MNYLISYDLLGTGRTWDEYTRLEEAILRIDSTAVRALYSAWLVRTPADALLLSCALQAHVADPNKLFITEITENWWAAGLSLDAISWLQLNCPNVMWVSRAQAFEIARTHLALLN